VRYVDEGDVLSAGGLTFGIDATLHLLRRRDGDAVARRVASAIRHPAPRAFETRRVAQNDFELADAMYLLNSAFYWPKRRTGVLLYDGVGEVELAAVFDVHPASFTDVAVTIADGRSVLSAHGLELVPRVHDAAHADVERVLVPGGVVAPEVDVSDVPVDRMPREYPFRAAVEDLARRGGIATARFAARRLELRTPWEHPRVSPFPLRLLWVPALTLATAIALILIFQRFRRSRRARKAA
jgi:AraC family transcriptional activator FtrA